MQQVGAIIAAAPADVSRELAVTAVGASTPAEGCVRSSNGSRGEAVGQR